MEASCAVDLHCMHAEAVPSIILESLPGFGLTREHVASHLQVPVNLHMIMLFDRSGTMHKANKACARVEPSLETLYSEACPYRLQTLKATSFVCLPETPDKSQAVGQ